MIINNEKITAQEFAWDECHKIYLIDTPEDKKELLGLDYKLFPIEQLEQSFKNSCDLKFISHGDLNLPNVVNQFEEAIFQ